MSVISIASGKCGISIQEQQWITLLNEQGIDKSGIATPQEFYQRLDSYFGEVKHNIYKPRALFTDLDDQQINRLENGSLSKLFEGVPKIYETTGSHNTFARAMYSVGSELKEEIENKIRYLVEQCDCVDSIQIQRSLCGGTGSGLGNLINSIVTDNYFSNIMQSQLVQYPDIQEISKLNLEIYNTIFAQNTLVESDIVLPFCNSNVQKLVSESFNLQKCKNFEDINAVVSQLHPSLTCGVRYGGSLNASTRKICTNLIPFQRIKLLTSTYLPYNYYKQTQLNNIGFPELIPSTLSDQFYFFSEGDPDIIASRHIFRGIDIHEEEIEMSLSKLYQNKKIKKAYWAPNTYSMQYCSVPSPINQKQILTLITNRNISKELKIYIERFTQLFKRKAFVHHYLQEGMDEMEFLEAQSNAQDEVIEYTPWQEQFDEYDEQDLIE